MGMIASFLNSGFLGGLIGGLLVGYIALVIETYLKVPKWAQALMPMRKPGAMPGRSATE